MDKDAFYFPHFSNARNDRKLKRVRKDLGLEGYGIYFMLLEVLRDQTEYTYPYQDIDLLADEFNTSTAKIEAVLNMYGLFNKDSNNMFYSPNFYEYMKPYLKMKEQRREAGLKSGEVRRLKASIKAEQEEIKQLEIERPFNECLTTDERMLNENEQSKVKESKVKESKVKESKVKETKETKKKEYIDFSKLLNTEPVELQKALKNYIQHRKLIKKPIKSIVALELIIKKAKELGEPIAVIEQSIANGWQGLFEVKKVKNNSLETSQNGNVFSRLLEKELSKNGQS
ncbi:MAG: hypothetical protein RLZZ577_70 [Bacteroidota bacterium]